MFRGSNRHLDAFTRNLELITGEDVNGDGEIAGRRIDGNGDGKGGRGRRNGNKNNLE